MSRQKTAVIFGGTGFIGRNIIKELAKEGMQIKVATRVPESAYFLKPYGDVGQITPLYYSADDFNSIALIVSGADYVINCVGILFERGKDSFTKIHADLAENIATAAAITKAKRLVHISALGCDQSQSEYAKSKLDGETRVSKAFPNATILRPSIVFGADDDFFNRFAKLSKIMPFFPLIGGGNTRFQPVYVGDVAKAALAIINQNDQGENSPLGKIYELGGPEILTFKEIYETLFEHTQIARPLVPVSFSFAKCQATFLSLMPTPILTKDQVESLKTDNIISTSARKLRDLKIDPTGLGAILPSYLTTYRPGGRFGQ